MPDLASISSVGGVAAICATAFSLAAIGLGWIALRKGWRFRLKSKLLSIHLEPSDTPPRRLPKKPEDETEDV